MKWLKLLGVLALFGCQPSTIEVPVLYYDVRDEYIYDFKQRLTAIETTPIIHLDGRNSVTTQNQQFTSLIADHPIVVVNPVDRLSVLPMILKANQKAQTIIFFNREPLFEDFIRADSAFYIGADPQQSAQLQVQLINQMPFEKLDRNRDDVVQLIILKGEQGHQDAEIRTRGVIETLINSGYTIEVLEIRIANFDREQATHATTELLAMYPQVELIISNNDAMALGAIDALVSANWIVDTNNDGFINDSEPWFPVIGIDGLPEAIESMHRGFLFGTVKNDSDSMALAMVTLIDFLLAGKTLDTFPFTIENRKIYIDYILINRPQ